MTWPLYDADDGYTGAQRMTCTTHPDVAPFSSSIGVLASEWPVPATVYSVCPSCWLEWRRCPKASDIGLVERPDYWRVTKQYGARGDVLECAHHPSIPFRIDEACVKCALEDDCQTVNLSDRVSGE